jgi:hypothetical protein
MKTLTKLFLASVLMGAASSGSADPLTQKEATQCFELSKVYSAFLKEAESANSEQEYAAVLSGLKLEDPKLVGLAGLAWEYRKRDNQKETRRFFRACVESPPEEPSTAI